MEPIIQGHKTKEQRLDNFVRFVNEREAIRIKKEKGALRPYTDDDILHRYHFCNVRRADDRVTKYVGRWLPEAPRNRWFACAVARWFNEPDTLAQFPSLEYTWQAATTLKVLKGMHDAGKRIFRSSYIITGALSKKGDTKYETVIGTVLTPLYQHGPKGIIVADSCEQSWSRLLKFDGMGSFMAGQIVADWQTFGIIKGNDVSTWAPLGPGSRKGLEYLYRHEKPISQATGVIEMREVASYYQAASPKIGKTLSLHDVQNCLCEFSKYIRGWSKTDYRPHEGTLL